MRALLHHFQSVSRVGCGVRIGLRVQHGTIVLLASEPESVL
jgi:hypothetical protein